jgi:RNA polymerase sigma factor (sigma-70 family)
MVFSVCQSVLRQRHDAEDAFQAAFFILAQKAGSIRRHEGLAGWLQRVAYRVALKARTDHLRRLQREVKTARPAAVELSSDELSWSELRAILHETLAALPERFRTPLVLCYLQGLTQEEAARQLGWTPTTVKGRLQRGREKLRRRLERRGITLTAALAAALTAETLAETAVRSVRPFTTATATTTAAALAHGFLHSGLSMKWAILSALLLSAGLVAGGAALRTTKAIETTPLITSAAKATEKNPTPRSVRDVHGDPLPDSAVARLGTIRFTHGQGLRHLFFSPDGKTIYSEGGGWLRVWDAATGVERGQIVSTDHSLEQLVLTPDGERIVSLNQETHGISDVVHVWDLARRQEIQKLSLPVRRTEKSVTRRNALSPDGRLGAINLPTEMRIFDLTAGRELYKLAKGGKEIKDVVFAGNDQLVTADSRQVIDVWDAQTGRANRQFAHDAPVQVITSSADGRWLATLEHHTYAIDRFLDKDLVRVWDLKTGARKHTLVARPKSWFMSMYFSPDGKHLLASSKSPQRWDLTIWDVETGKQIGEMGDAAGMVLAVNSAGSRLAYGSFPGKFELSDLQTGNRLSSDDSRYARAVAVAFTPTNDRLVLLGYPSLSTWEVATGRRLEVFDWETHDYTPPIPALSSDGRYSLSFRGEWETYQSVIWDVGKRRRLRTLEDRCLTGAFSFNSSLLAIWKMGKGPTVGIYDLANGREMRSFSVTNAAYPFLSFTDEDRTLLIADRKIVGYEVSSGKVMFSWQMKPVSDNSGIEVAVRGQPAAPESRRAWRGFAASPDGTRVAVTLDGGFGLQPLRDRIALFDGRTGKLLRRWSDSGKPANNYERLCFSYDGQLLASSDGNAIHLWETATGKEIRTFRGHRGDIESLMFTHDDRLLASASRDSTVLIWDATGGGPSRVTTDAALAQAWKALAGDDAGRADEVVWSLARAPEKSLPFLKARLRPVQGISTQQLDKLLKDLDSDQFAVRETATTELQELGELVEPALRRVLENKPTVERRRRIESILAKLDAVVPSGDVLRSLRAVRVLGHAGTPEAAKLLRELANGADGASLTRTARVTLTYLNRRAQ